MRWAATRSTASSTSRSGFISSRAWVPAISRTPGRSATGGPSGAARRRAAMARPCRRSPAAGAGCTPPERSRRGGRRPGRVDRRSGTSALPTGRFRRTQAGGEPAGDVLVRGDQRGVERGDRDRASHPDRHPGGPQPIELLGVHQQADVLAVRQAVQVQGADLRDPGGRRGGGPPRRVPPAPRTPPIPPARRRRGRPGSPRTVHRGPVSRPPDHLPSRGPARAWHRASAFTHQTCDVTKRRPRIGRRARRPARVPEGRCRRSRWWVDGTPVRGDGARGRPGSGRRRRARAGAGGGRGGREERGGAGGAHRSRRGNGGRTSGDPGAAAAASVMKGPAPPAHRAPSLIVTLAD